MGRVWQSGIGGALTFSVLWRFDQGAGWLGGLSLAAGIAGIRASTAVGAGPAEAVTHPAGTTRASECQMERLDGAGLPPRSSLEGEELQSLGPGALHR